MLTPIGLGCEANAFGFRQGNSCFRPVSFFDVSRQRVKCAAELDLPSALPRTRLSLQREQRLDRAACMLIHATSEALEQSGWESGTGVPVVLGTTSGGMGRGEEFYRVAAAKDHAKHGQPRRVITYQASHQGWELCDAFGLSGPLTIISNACASGANAVGHAWELVRHGVTDRVLAGGYDALCQLVFAGFDSLQALSPTICRPFDAHRDGLALGEGAAVLTIETFDSARSRGADILAEIAGYGAATDVHHLTQPHPAGDAALATMIQACQTAGLAPCDIQYLNAHGTGTPLNDRAEAAAIDRWAGECVESIPVSSTKAGIGHLLGAAGAVEVAICVLALRGQWLPPMPAVQSPDSACRFPLVRAAANARLEHVLTNSFGFGGANASIVLRGCS